MRPRLLFLTQTLPYPPDSGARIRTFNVLRLLAREFEVTALCFCRRSTHSLAADVTANLAALQSYARLEAFAIPQEHSRLRLVIDHAASVLRWRPYTFFAYSSRGFRNRLLELLANGDFDLVHLDSLDLSGYLPLLSGGLPIVCAHHNVESILLQRRASAEHVALRRAYLHLQARLLEREERRWITRVALNVTVSDHDRHELERIAQGGTYAVVPNGVDTSFYKLDTGVEKEGLVFAGGLDWHPNRDALDYFAADILPLLHTSDARSSVRWIGHAPEDIREHYRVRHGIDLTGYVHDIRPLVSEAKCYIVPLRIGGGTRLKILDAWAMGKAVVSTAIGCEGLEARDGENILIRDNPREFAEAVQMVLRDRALRTRLGRAARATVEQLYDWEVIGAKMIREYSALV